MATNYEDEFNPDEFNKYASEFDPNELKKVKDAQQQQTQPVGDFQSNLKQLAPSNVMKNIGVASANAPGATQIAANMLPGGNPQQIMQGVQNVSQNPQQILQAFNRVAQVNSGQPMTPQEKPLGIGGQIGGMAIEAGAGPNPFETIKPTGPFTAGLSHPESAVPGALKESGKVVGETKDLARRLDDPAIAARLRRLLSSPSGVSKVAEEGKAAVEAGKNSSVTELLAYRQALGAMQSKGGTFANDYKNAFDLATEQLAKKAPEVMAAMKNYSINALARTGEDFHFPTLTTAIDPTIGGIKAAYNVLKMAPVRNTIGAALSHPNAIASPLLEAFNRLSRRKG